MGDTNCFFKPRNKSVFPQQSVLESTPDSMFVFIAGRLVLLFHLVHQCVVEKKVPFDVSRESVLLSLLKSFGSGGII